MPIYRDYTSNAFQEWKTGPVHAKINGKYPPATSPYQHHKRRVSPPLPGTSWYLSSTMPEMSYTIPTSVNNRLYSKLREELMGKTGELLTSMVEWKTSLDMITGRARTIYGAYLAVRRFQFKKAADLLNIATPGKFKNLSSKAARRKGLSPTGVWLEYWMGWAPLMGDIGLAIETLSGRPTVTKQHFSVGVVHNDRKVKKLQSSLIYTYPGYRWTNIELSFVYNCKLSAYGDVLVTNHNRYLANKMGFTNPVLTFWQLIPFSFIADWFVNVGQVLGSLTDFEGLAFTNTGTAQRIEVTATAKGVTWDGWSSSSVVPVKQDGIADLSDRRPGPLPSPRLEARMLDRLSLTRAATSIGLLTEIFLRK